MNQRSNGTVLIVDDDPTVLEYVSVLFKEYGYLVVPCQSANDAMARLKETRVDVVLTDVMMPVVSGIELLDHIHKTEPELPVILMTAYADLDTAVDAVKKGAFDFIIKPFKQDQLVHSVEKAVNYRMFVKMENDYRHILEEFNQGIETLVSERTMSLMALTIADKVRNPVTVIGLTSKKILEEEGVPDKLRGKLTDIVAEVEKLEAIVRDFQTVLKSRQSMFSYEDINGLLKGLVPIIEKEAAYKGASLVMSLSEQPLKINIQKNLLRIAILHVLRNAVEATNNGGSVRVSTSGDKDKITLSISDTGQGIAKADIDKIFDPFYSTKKHRFGMGLALVKQIVSEHMGEISVESEMTRGTTFSMIFPVRWLTNKQTF